MKIKSATYFLDAQAAIDASLDNTAEDEIYYYDGAEISSAPQNCINVPVDGFYSYFQSGLNLLPVKLDFGNKAFSDAVQAKIAQSIEEIIELLRKEIVNKIDISKVNQETIESAINPLLVLLYSVNNGISEAESALIEKVIQLSLAVYEKNGFAFNNATRESLVEYWQSFSENDLINNIKALSVWYGLGLILNPKSKTEADKKYFEVLAQSSDLMEIYNNYHYITEAFPVKYFDAYIENYTKALFDDGFFDKTIRHQKEAVCKLVYFTIMFYERNKSFLKIYTALYDIYRQALSRGLSELVLWLYSPLLYCHNSILISQDDFAKFNQQVDKPLENYIKSKLIAELQCLPCRENANTELVKVGFVVERVLDYSLTNVLCALLNNLSTENLSHYEFTVYDLNFKELGGSNAEAVAKLCATGFKYVDLHQEIVGTNEHFYSILDKVVKVRDKIIQDDIGLLIATNGRPEVNFLFATRTAPVQVFWTHGNYVFDCDGIDKRIVHYQTEDYKVSGFEFIEFEIAADYGLQNPKAYQDKALQLKQKWPQETIFVGSIGRLSKLESDSYLAIVAKLLKDNPNTVYLACGSGDSAELKAKLDRLGVLERFYFEGYVDPGVYAFVIDIYLDPFPHGGGESLQEYRARTQQGLVVCVNDEPVRFLSNGLDAYVLKASTYIQYLKRQDNAFKYERPESFTGKTIMCSDAPINESQAGLIAYLLEKYNNLFYAIPKNNPEFSVFIAFFPEQKLLLVDVEDMFSYAKISDLYLTFYNYALRDICLIPDNIVHIQIGDFLVQDKTIGDLWNIIDSGSPFAEAVIQLTAGDKTGFDTVEGRRKAFRQFHELAGLDAGQMDALWNAPGSGIEKEKMVCEMMLSNKGFAELMTQFTLLMCNYRTNTSITNKPLLAPVLNALYNDRNVDA
ncbi:MAG: hypothetical protein CTY29_06330 [Methylobacter sp.]|nr:MAG: hypothetical protein CTY29_06330 [Methylobacter sp.]